MKKKDKENIILGQKKETKEAMKFYDDSRPTPDVEDDLSTRNTPFSKVEFPKASDDYSNYEELLASEEYRDALQKLGRFTGVRNIGSGFSGSYGRLSMDAINILREIMNIESNKKNELEELCVKIIKEYFDIPDGKVEYDFKLISNAIKIDENPSEEELEEKEELLVKELQKLTPERAKRRLINAMTQGHAVDGTYIFNKFSRELQEITGVQNITEKYSIFVSIMMLGYWQFPKTMLAGAMGSGGGSGSAAGRSKVDVSTSPITIYAEAMIFPFLIHEAIKSVMEYLGMVSEPENEDDYKKAMDLEDQVVHEIWDIRIGPAIWRRLVSALPDALLSDENARMLQYYLYHNLANLPAKLFLLCMKEILEKTEDGKKLFGALFYDLKCILDDEEVGENNHFESVVNEIYKKHGTEENENLDEFLDKFLNDLGLSFDHSTD